MSNFVQSEKLKQQIKNLNRGDIIVLKSSTYDGFVSRKNYTVSEISRSHLKLEETGNFNYTIESDGSICFITEIVDIIYKSKRLPVGKGQLDPNEIFDKPSQLTEQGVIYPYNNQKEKEKTMEQTKVNITAMVDPLFTKRANMKVGDRVVYAQRVHGSYGSWTDKKESRITKDLGTYVKLKGSKELHERQDDSILEVLPAEPSLISRLAKGSLRLGWKLTWKSAIIITILLAGYAVAQLKLIPQVLGWVSTKFL